MSEHSPEPWSICPQPDGSWFIIIPGERKDYGNGMIGMGKTKIVARLSHQGEEDAERIVACVNACVGMDDAALRELYAKNAHLRGCLPNVTKDDPRWQDVIRRADLRSDVVSELKMAGYTIIDPSKMDFSDKISRVMPKDKQ